MTQINWTDLIVTDADGGDVDTLGDLVELAPETLNRLELAPDGSIDNWPQYFVNAPGDGLSHEIPEKVDWSGFAEALGR